MNALQRDPQRLLKDFRLCATCPAPLHEWAVADSHAAGQFLVRPGTGKEGA